MPRQGWLRHPQLLAHVPRDPERLEAENIYANLRRCSSKASQSLVGCEGTFGVVSRTLGFPLSLWVPKSPCIRPHIKPARVPLGYLLEAAVASVIPPFDAPIFDLGGIGDVSWYLVSCFASCLFFLLSVVSHSPLFSPVLLVPFMIPRDGHERYQPPRNSLGFRIGKQPECHDSHQTADPPLLQCGHLIMMQAREPGRLL
ncbi:hypothetical protein VTI74DRAFT_7502 [Chaetomium olivicolor]